MTEDHKRLLAVFEVRVRDLMALCDQQKRRIDELTAALSLKDEELRQAKDMIEGLNAKCDNMLTARIVSTNEEEMKNARMRLSKLVREVDKCIALLHTLMGCHIDDPLHLLCHKLFDLLLYNSVKICFSIVGIIIFLIES